MDAAIMCNPFTTSLSKALDFIKKLVLITFSFSKYSASKGIKPINFLFVLDAILVSIPFSIHSSFEMFIC